MYSYKDSLDLDLITKLVTELGLSDLSNSEFVIDSRKVTKGSIFCAYPGAATDGRKYIDDVVSRGVKAIIYEDGYNFTDELPHYPVKNLVQYIGLLASAKYNHPSAKFTTIGVTGTNGKTSITYWLAQMYMHLGKKSGVIGTTGSGIYPNISNGSLTTPDPISLQKTFATFLKENVNMVGLEVSSIGLDQGRVNGTSFKTAIFTNFTQDHLDYHRTMEAYYLAKQKLFFWQTLQNAIINIDDEYGIRLLNDLKSDKMSSNDLNLLTYAINKRADFTAHNIKITLSGMTFDVHYQGQIEKVKVGVIGKFNVYNILAVIAALISEGYLIDQIIPLLDKLTPVCGRMDVIRVKDMPLVIVDYAHTPDALENTLLTLAEVEHTGKLYCIFGCGGDRDVTKRPLMGQIAVKLADFVYITSDNPRYEDPQSIVSQIAHGCDKNNYRIIVDRAEAIKQVISIANPNDIILIAGKGHETYQEIKGVKYDFSDFKVASDSIKYLEMTRQ